MTTRPASSSRSLYQLLDRRATGVLLTLMLSVVSVAAAFRGVGTRNQGRSFHCEVYFAGVSDPREKVWVGSFPTAALAALACDVVFYYTNRPSGEFNLPYSEGLILENCELRSAYDRLGDWDERKTFIKDQAEALINLMSSEDQYPDLHWGDVTVPPVHQGTGDIACDLVDNFPNQDERLPELMARVRRLSNAATRSTHTGDVQTFLQQQSDERISQSDIEEAVPVGGDQVVDAARVRSFFEAVRALSGGALWPTLIASSLALLRQICTERNAHDVKDATISAKDAASTEQERCQSRGECSTKKRKAKHTSIELDPDEKDLFAAILLDVKNEAWQCTGYGIRSKTWRTLPPFSFLAAPAPAPAPNFCDQYYSVCGHGSLMCANVSSIKAELVVFNPLTGKNRPLPPLLFPRHPVLLHMSADSATKSYRVIVAGSSRSDEKHLSKKMEMFDPRTSQWEEMCDVPGPEFGLNDYQAGVCVNGILYMIACVEGDAGKGVVAFDVDNRKWLPNMTCPISCSSSFAVIQLFENTGEVYLFSERVDKQCMRRIDVLQISNPDAGEATCHWRMKCQMSHGMRARKSHLKHTCVGFGEGKLCVFDNFGTGGMVYDMRSGSLSEILEHDRDAGLDLTTKITASFSLQLSRDSDPFPSSVDDIQKEPTPIVCPFSYWENVKFGQIN